MHHRIRRGGLVDAGVNFDLRALGDPRRSIDEATLHVADNHVLGPHDGQRVQSILPAFDHKPAGLGRHAHAGMPQARGDPGGQSYIGQDAVGLSDLKFDLLQFRSHLSSPDLPDNGRLRRDNASGRTGRGLNDLTGNGSTIDRSDAHAGA